MFMLWTLLGIIPLAMRSEALPVGPETVTSPAEDPPPIPSIERLYRNGYPSDIEEMHIDDDPTYQHLDSETRNQEVYAAKRRKLNQFSFSVEPKDSFTPERSSRRHKAMTFKPEEGEYVGYVYGQGTKHRSRRGATFPAVDAVDENPAQWKRFDNKPQFVTSRTQSPVGTREYYQGVPQHRVAHNMGASNPQNMRYNEIPLPSSEPPRYPNSYVRDPITDYRHEDPPRRIIYYATLPEITNGRPIDPNYRRDRPGYDVRYDYSRSFSKYPRESNYDDGSVRQSARDDRYRYRPTGNGASYAIIDAERPPPPPPGAYTPSTYRDPDAMSRYNRIPAPYQQSQPGGRLAYDSRNERPNAALHPSRYSPYGRTGGNLPRNQLTVAPAVDEPYRDYNPRQPAPWSLQIGTKLTVKDDGRPMPSPGGKRFYVESQRQQYPNRYLRSGDDPDTRQK